MNKKGITTIIRWAVLLTVFLVLLWLYFVQFIPGAGKLLEEHGIIDIEDIKEKQEKELTLEEEEAAKALRAITRSFESCMQETGSYCSCSSSIPPFEKKYTIAFESFEGGFGTAVYEGAVNTKLPGKIIYAEIIDKVNLCVSRDLLEVKKEMAEGKSIEQIRPYKEESLFNMYISKGRVLINIPEHDDEYTVLPKLYRIDENNICIFININEGLLWDSQYGKSDTKKLVNLIGNEIPSCGKKVKNE